MRCEEFKILRGVKLLMLKQNKKLTIENLY